MESGLILIGVGCIIGAIVGGGVKLVQVELAQVTSLRRQVMLGIFGIMLVAAGLIAGGHLQIPGSRTDTETATAVGSKPSKAPNCSPGFVWREAFPGDATCVTPAARKLVAEENTLAASRRADGGGPYGNDTCLSGFVWREASPSDHVCVDPERRRETALQNSVAAPQ
jgi:hypothetical protein